MRRRHARRQSIVYHTVGAFPRHAPCLLDITAAPIAVLLFHRRFPNQETTMQWTTPAYTDLRFGFEITMYIANR